MIKLLAIVDDVNQCDCCGKDNLKRTVALDILGDVKHYGVVCAGRALGKKTKSVNDVKAAVFEVNEFEKIKADVLKRRLDGENVVYGRFYISSRSHKTKMKICKPSDLLNHQVFPAKLDNGFL